MTLLVEPVRRVQWDSAHDEELIRLTKYTHMPREKMCRQFNVSNLTLRAQWRRLGIHNWRVKHRCQWMSNYGAFEITNEELRQLYEKGLSVVKIQKIYGGRLPHYINRLKYLGCYKSVKKRVQERYKWSPELEQNLRFYILDMEMTREEVAEKLGIPVCGVDYYYKRLNLRDEINRRRIKEKEIAISLYQQGSGLTEISKKLERDFVWVREVLITSGVYRKGIHVGRYRAIPFTDEINQRLASMYTDQQMDMEAIGKALDYCPRAIARRLDILGVQKRSRSIVRAMAHATHLNITREMEIDLLLAYVEEHLTIREAAKKAKVPERVAKEKLEKWGFKRCVTETGMMGFRAFVARNRNVVCEDKVINSPTSVKERQLTPFEQRLITDNYEEIKQRVRTRLASISMVHAMLGTGRSIDDIVDEAVSTLTKSVQIYVPDKNNIFVEFAVQRCVWGLTDRVRAVDPMKRKGRDRQKTYIEAVAKCEARGFPVSNGALVEILAAQGISTDEAERIIRDGQVKETKFSEMESKNEPQLATNLLKALITFDTSATQWVDTKRLLYSRLMDFFVPHYGSDGKTAFCTIVENVIPKIENREFVDYKTIGKRHGCSDSRVCQILQNFLSNEQFREIIVNTLDTESELAA